MKRSLAMLMALALCLGCCVPALAEDGGFTDVKPGAWYADAVDWAAENGITNGISAAEFGVEYTVNRAQMVTFLWRMAGAPAPRTANPFSDVPEGTWYTDAVRWAAENGLAKGTSATTFAPLADLTREQAATFLYREEQRRGGGFRGMWAFPLDFSDASEVSDYAYEPLCWMTMEQVVEGADGALAPKAPCTRAELVTMLWRYAEPLAAPEEPGFTDTYVPVLRETTESDETARLRCYEDLPDVPYMEITEYYDRFCTIGTDVTQGLTASRIGSHCILTTAAGYTAEADTRTDTMVVADFSAFIEPLYYRFQQLSGAVDDSIPYLKEAPYVYTPAVPQPLTLRLGDYGIDLRGGQDGLYLPLATLSDIFASSETVYTVFNGEKIYVQEYLQLLQNGSALAEDPDYAAPLERGRSEQLADFTYRELCFAIDTFYGRPGQEFIHDALESRTLDDILSEDYPDIKQQLCAEDLESFLSGLNLLLHGLLFDGGHTSLYSHLMGAIPGFSDAAVATLLSTEIGGGFLDYAVKEVMGQLLSLYQDAVYGDDYYVEQGDTAMIRFPSFDIDSEGWKAYYAGTGDMPLEGDTVGTVYAGLLRAAANPEIRNVVIDVSCNGGGTTATEYAILSLMTGQYQFWTTNRLTGQTLLESGWADANFDGAFDENDQPFTQFRYGVLTSCYSFSCANSLPFLMRDHGAMILGQQSSGGTCTIRFFQAGGVEICCSSAAQSIVTSTGETMDNGCPVDLELFETLEEEQYDPVTGDPITGYESFYDIGIISAAMNEFFGASEDAAG